MLYLNELEKITEQLRPEYNLLFQKVLENQINIGDLLIVYNNFTKNNHMVIKGCSPFVMGLNFEGFSEVKSKFVCKFLILDFTQYS